MDATPAARPFALPQRARAACAAMAVLALMGCTAGTSTRNLPEARELGIGIGYRAANLGRVPGQEVLPQTYMVLAFSGGGTRATALAHGVLRELEATPAPGATSGATMLEAVDQISSASGGSVAAANYVAHGRAGYRRIEEPGGFLHHDGITELVTGVLNPVNSLYYATTSASRIELASAMFRRTIFGTMTYGDLYARRAERMPLLVLNAADMASGERFPFSQAQLDLLCLDLRSVQLADAVTASAAFPVALTPLPLPNHSPCAAQREPVRGQGQRNPRTQGRTLLFSGRFAEFDSPVPCDGSVELLTTLTNPRRSRSLRQLPLLNLDPCQQERELPEADPRRIRMVHLLDGGTADNLGLDGLLETISADGDDPRVRNGLDATVNRSGNPPLTRIVVLSVNARSQSSTRTGADGSTPGILSMLSGTIGTAIDGRSGGLSAQLAVLGDLMSTRYQGKVSIVDLRVDFEMIQDPRCRAAFQEIATTWTLPAVQVAALQEMAGAMLRASPQYRALAELPASAAAEAQQRAAAACNRLRGPAVTSPPASSRG